MHVVVADMLLVGEAALVFVAERDFDAARLDRGVDPGGGGRIGQHVAALEIGGEHLADFDIGRDVAALARLLLLLLLREGGRRRQRGEGPERHEQRVLL